MFASRFVSSDVTIFAAKVSYWPSNLNLAHAVSEASKRYDILCVVPYKSLTEGTCSQLTLSRHSKLSRRLEMSRFNPPCSITLLISSEEYVFNNVPLSIWIWLFKSSFSLCRLWTCPCRVVWFVWYWLFSSITFLYSEINSSVESVKSILAEILLPVSPKIWMTFPLTVWVTFCTL